MLRIIDDKDFSYQELCNGITCDSCTFYRGHCGIKEWIEKQPRFEDKEKIIPVATITFDEDKMKEICDKAISDLIITCPNCGEEIKPKKGGEKS